MSTRKGNLLRFPMQRLGGVDPYAGLAIRSSAPAVVGRGLFCPGVFGGSGLRVLQSAEGGPVVTRHQNAKTCPASRRLMCERVEGGGWSLRAVAAAAGIGERRAGEWLARWRADDHELDRLIPERTRLLRPQLVVKPVKAAPRNLAPPLPHRVGAAPQPRRYLLPLLALSPRQHDPTAQRPRLRAGRPPDPALHTALSPIADHDRCALRRDSSQILGDIADGVRGKQPHAYELTTQVTSRPSAQEPNPDPRL